MSQQTSFSIVESFNRPMRPQCVDKNSDWQSVSSFSHYPCSNQTCSDQTATPTITMSAGRALAKRPSRGRQLPSKKSKRPRTGQQPCLSDDMWIFIFSRAMEIDSISAVSVLPLVCRRWRQLFFEHVSFRSTNGLDWPMRPTKPPMYTRATIPPIPISHSVAMVAARFRRVQSLRLVDFARVTEPCYSAIGRCPTIVRLDLSRTNYDGRIITPITDASLAIVVAGCRALTHVNLHGCCHVTDAGTASLFRLASLTHLDLSDTNVTGEGVEPCPTLACLNLRGAMVSDAGLDCIAAALPGLVDLDLGNTPITAFTVAFPALVNLSLSNTKITTFTSPLPALVKLDLSNTMVTTFTSFLPALASLNLSGTRVVDNDATLIVARCPVLNRLFLWRTPVTVVGTSTIGVNYPALSISA